MPRHPQRALQRSPRPPRALGLPGARFACSGRTSGNELHLMYPDIARDVGHADHNQDSGEQEASIYNDFQQIHSGRPFLMTAESAFCRPPLIP